MTEEKKTTFYTQAQETLQKIMNIFHNEHI